VKLVTSTARRLTQSIPSPPRRSETVLGRRWSPHVLYLLGQRPARFTELQRAIPGISANSLNERLRDLVDEGLVLRRAFPGPPMTSSYETTPTGQVIGEHLIRMTTAPAFTPATPAMNEIGKPIATPRSDRCDHSAT
jgi:DNA-binding HxlR family transcriptional regulator